jgi:hypothetical protein
MNRRRKIWFWLPRYTKVWKVVSKDFSHYHHKFPTPVVHTCQDSSNVSFQDLACCRRRFGIGSLAAAQNIREE